MNILAIDTTTKKANVGIYFDGNIDIKSIDNEITHSEKLLPLIDNVLKANNCNLHDIDIISCTTGPGSFTGIRIGIATVKAIAKVTNAKIHSMNCLELLAKSKTNSKYKLIVSLIDAKNKRAYAGIYENINNTLTELGELQNKLIQDIVSEVYDICKEKNLSIEDDVLFVIDSENITEEISGFNFEKACIDLNVLIDSAMSCKEFENYLTVDATYVRSSQAERVKYGE